MDGDLLRSLQKQSADALEQAIAQYGAYVLTIIRNRSRGVLTPEDHEEIASDVFLSLWHGAREITSGQVSPWLGAVARNKTVEACAGRRSLFRWKTTRLSRSTGFGSKCMKASAAKQSGRHFPVWQRRTVRFSIGFMICRRQPGRSQSSCI